MVRIFKRSDEVLFESAGEVAGILDCVRLNGRQLCLQMKIETQPDKRDHRQPKIGRALVERAKPGLVICGDIQRGPLNGCTHELKTRLTAFRVSKSTDMQIFSTITTAQMRMINLFL